MKVNAIPIAVVGGIGLIALDIMGREPGALVIAGCILLGAALIAANCRR